LIYVLHIVDNFYINHNINIINTNIIFIKLNRIFNKSNKFYNKTNINNILINIFLNIHIKKNIDNNKSNIISFIKIINFRRRIKHDENRQCSDKGQ
jgi:hypothetical protein